MNIEDLAWAAGTFESEGTVTIARRWEAPNDTYRLLCSVVNTDATMVEFFQTRWPSWLNGTRGHDRGNRRPFWQWTVAGPRAAAFLEDIALHVRTQRVDTKIRLGLEFFEHQRHWRERFRAGADYKETQRRLYVEMKELNRRGLVEEVA